MCITRTEKVMVTEILADSDELQLLDESDYQWVEAWRKLVGKGAKAEERIFSAVGADSSLL